MRRVRHAAALLLILVCAACTRPEQREKPLSVPGEKIYTLKGTILARTASDNTLRVDHEAIPGFMEAMTMDYSVRGTAVVSLPKDGARIEARLHVTDDGYWLTDVRQSP
jgi:protein SCO1/2